MHVTSITFKLLKRVALNMQIYALERATNILMPINNF